METDFLTESTRKLRKSLLVAGLIGFAISYAGLRVSEVSLLGSKLSITKFEVIPLVLGIVVSYFLVTFIIFGLYDYAQTYRRVRLDVVESLSKGTISSAKDAGCRIYSLNEEYNELNLQLIPAQIESPERADKIKYKMREIEREIEKLSNIKRFYEDHTFSILERFVWRRWLKKMRTILDLYVPILVGLYVAILLFFFTKIPELNDTTHKPEQGVIVSEKVSSNDANQVTSDSLIDNPEIDEQK